MNLRITGLVVFSLLMTTIISCKEEAKEKIKQYTLIGKTATISYPDFDAEIDYISTKKLHWKTIQKDGEIAEGTETIFYEQISPKEFFINWIERDGLTVSKIVNVETGEVNAFISYKNESDIRNKRSGVLLQGNWTEKKKMK